MFDTQKSKKRLMKKLFIDWETYYTTGKNGYSLKKLSSLMYVRDSRFKVFGLGAAFESDSPTWVTVERLWILIEEIERSVGWSNIALVGHNLKFDALILKEKYGIKAGQYIDTMGMARAVLGKSVKGHSLDLLAKHFGLEAKGIMATDGKETLTQEEENALAAYCLHDVELCRTIYQKLAVDFPENQYEALHRTVDMFVSPKLVLNVPLLEETAKAESARRANIFLELGLDKKVFASNVKFPKLLESRGFECPMKNSPKKKDKDGEPLQIPALALGDEEFLDMLESENDELRTLCEARVAAKSTLLETRSGKLAAIGKTGTWPFDVQFSGADQTHRFSGGSGAGGNPQNFTRGSALRTAVEAPAGYKLVVGDFSNIELRIVAYLSKDPGLVQAIEQGIDIYCDFASVFYGRNITKEDKDERFFGKTAILGLGYGCGWRKFQKMVRIQTGKSISDDDAKKAVSLYRTRYSKVPALWEKLDGMIPFIADREKKALIWDLPGSYGYQYFQLPSGLKIKYPNLRLEEIKGKLQWVFDTYKQRRYQKASLYGGKCLENISQALAGEICKEAMLKMGENVVGQVHDELLVVAKKPIANIVAQKLKRVMSTSPDWLPQIRLAAEVGIAPNWGEAKA
jgi:DNA polymerase